MNKAGTQRIETQRLILRRFKIEDAEDMYNNWASDPEVTRFLTWPAHSSVDVTRSLLTDWVTRYADGGYFNWVMEYKETGNAIGNISVVKLNENTEAADMGYCMSRAYWGQGLMPEALKAVMAYLFDVVGLNRIAACHDVNNPKSGRVMDKAGMKQEGILRAAGKNNLGICDEVWHAAIREDRDTFPELEIELQDTEWPFEFSDHDRLIARAICFDDDGFFYFVRARRDDDFGKATLIETSGGGVEAGEDLQSAIRRELKEELGAEVDTVRKIGVVSDYYNLIHRHNLNNYFLCKVKSFGDKNLTKDEIEDFHLSTLKMTYEEAVSEYEKRRETRIGRLIANRELPVLLRAKEMMERIELKPVVREDIETVWRMQVEAFSELLEKYQDYETSPAAEGVDKVLARFGQPWTTYYFIMAGDEKVGVIRVVEKKDGSRKRISPIWIMPEYRNKGYAQQAIREVEKIYGPDHWCLDTILQEKGNLHLYEKLGYHRTGRVDKINERMDIVFYEK